MKTKYESPAAQTVCLRAESMLALSFYDNSSSGSPATADTEAEGGGMWGAQKEGGNDGGIWRWMEN